MTNKIIMIGLTILGLCGGFYLGKMTQTEPEVVAIKAKLIDKDVKETTTTTKNKDGSVVIVKTKDTSVKSQTTSQTESKPSESKVLVQGMYGYHFTDRKPMYGAAVSGNIIGSLNGGVFFLTNGMTESIVGGVLGLEF